MILNSSASTHYTQCLILLPHKVQMEIRQQLPYLRIELRPYTGLHWSIASIETKVNNSIFLFKENRITMDIVGHSSLQIWQLDFTKSIHTMMWSLWQIACKQSRSRCVAAAIYPLRCSSSLCNLILYLSLSLSLPFNLPSLPLFPIFISSSPNIPIHHANVGFYTKHAQTYNLQIS